jgi:hypothetical protein
MLHDFITNPASASELLAIDTCSHAQHLTRMWDNPRTTNRIVASRRIAISPAPLQATTSRGSRWTVSFVSIAGRGQWLASKRQGCFPSINGIESRDINPLTARASHIPRVPQPAVRSWSKQLSLEWIEEKSPIRQVNHAASFAVRASKASHSAHERSRIFPNQHARAAGLQFCNRPTQSVGNKRRASCVARQQSMQLESNSTNRPSSTLWPACSQPMARPCAHFTRGARPWRIALLLHRRGAACPISPRDPPAAAPFGPLFWGGVVFVPFFALQRV